MPFKRSLQRFWAFLKRENIHRIILIIIILVIFGSVGLSLLEPNVSLTDAIWWSVVTLTTVGYGDISPSSAGGRIIALVIMLVGIGILGVFSATIASILVDRKIKEDLGMTRFNFTNHIILCTWNPRTHTVLDELRADASTAATPIVLIADIERKPVDDPELYFIQGDVSDETLERANLAQASTVVILGDDALNDTSRDAKVVLATLTIESINPHAYTIAELADKANKRHCERANVDEIIIGNELSSGLMARAALNHGITRFVTEVLSSQQGNELYKLAAPASMVGQSFIDIFVEMKKQQQSIVLAVQQGNEGRLISNPPADYRLAQDDYLIVVAEQKPVL